MRVCKHSLFWCRSGKETYLFDKVVRKCMKCSGREKMDLWSTILLLMARNAKEQKGRHISVSHIPADAGKSPKMVLNSTGDDVIMVPHAGFLLAAFSGTRKWIRGWKKKKISCDWLLGPEATFLKRATHSLRLHSEVIWYVLLSISSLKTRKCLLWRMHL